MEPAWTDSLVSCLSDQTTMPQSSLSTHLIASAAATVATNAAADADVVSIVENNNCS